MRKRRETLHKLAITANIMGTLSGGISEPVVRNYKLSNSHEIKIKIPGVNSDVIKVEIHNNWLTIFHMIQLPTGDIPMEIPRMVHSSSIPYFIDVEKIAAHVEQGYLRVSLPFNERANGYHRKVSIKQ